MDKDMWRTVTYLVAHIIIYVPIYSDINRRNTRKDLVKRT